MPKLPFHNILYNEYEHTDGFLVAIEQEESKKIGAFLKQYKSQKKQPNDTINGYKFIIDEEFNSLKIDFENPTLFQIKDLQKVKLQ